MPLLVLLAALSAAIGPTAPDDADVAAAIKTWEKHLWKGADDLVAVQQALLALGRHDHPQVASELLDFLEECDVALRVTIRHLLVGMTRVDSLERMRSEGLGSKRALLREQVALLGAEGLHVDPPWCERLLELLDDEDARVRAAAVMGLGRSGYAPALPALVAASLSDAAIVRARAAHAMADLAGERSLSQLAHLLDDGNWRVRAAAASALGRVHSPRAAAPLVARLERESGRVREDILVSLRRVTGVDYGVDVAAWKRWLVHVGERQTLRAPDRARGQPTSAVERLMEGVPRYYGVPVLSSRFLLITDVSGSMDTPASGSVDRVGGPGATRLDVAKQELIALLDALEESVRFDLVRFSADALFWREKLVPAKPSQLAAARLELEGWPPGGATNTLAALDAALDLAESELYGDRYASERAPDTVFLLTDGEPTVGRVLDRELLVDYVIERNRYLDLRLHCVGFYPRIDFRGRSFLRRLARVTGGEAVTPLE